jgi:hypothetical protein
MKCVVDSNYLQSEELRAFLGRASSNFAVFADYAFIEATKDDTLATVYKSLAVLADYPSQVVVLKTTWSICSLHGGSKGLQRRLVDVPRTREFAVFCQALRYSERGEPTMRQELLRLGKQATDHLQGVRSDASAFAEVGLDAATLFTRDEQYQVLHSDRLPTQTLRKLAQAAIWQSEVLFANHPAVRRVPTAIELPNTYIFRSSLCHLLLVLKWAYSGGASPKPDRLRNDMVDTHFAAYSTYFDSLLSNDKTPILIARQARAHLPAIASAIAAAVR